MEVKPPADDEALAETQPTTSRHRLVKRVIPQATPAFWPLEGVAGRCSADCSAAQIF